MLRFGRIYRNVLAENLSARTVTSRRSFISAICNKDKGCINTVCLNLLNDKIVYNVGDEQSVSDVEVISIPDAEFESVCRKLTHLKSTEVFDLRYQTYAQVERAVLNLKLNGLKAFVAVSQDLCPLFSGRLVFDHIKIDERYTHISSL